MFIPRLDEFWQLAWDPVTKQARHRLDFGFENNQAILENWVFKYFLLCSILGEYDYCDEILSGLDFYVGIIPRCRYYGASNMQVADPGNGWEHGFDEDNFPCQLRTDMGVGQAPCVLGLYAIRDKFQKAGNLWMRAATSICDNGFKMTYRGKVVPQGNYMSLIPPFSNNILEALCIAESMDEKIPFFHRWRVAPSLWRAWTWPNIKKRKLVWSSDEPLQRSLCLHFLANIHPRKYGNIWKDWIRSRDKDVEDARTLAEATTDLQHPDWLARQLNYALEKAIRT